MCIVGFITPYFINNDTWICYKLRLTSTKHIKTYCPRPVAPTNCGLNIGGLSSYAVGLSTVHTFYVFVLVKGFLDDTAIYYYHYFL